MEKPTTGRMLEPTPEWQSVPKENSFFPGVKAVKVDPLLPPGTFELRNGGRFVRGNLKTGEIVEGTFIELDLSDIELRITVHATTATKKE